MKRSLWVALKLLANLVQEAFSKLTKPRHTSGPELAVRPLVLGLVARSLCFRTTSVLGFVLRVLLCVSKASWLDGAGTSLCPAGNGTGLGSSERIVLG